MNRIYVVATIALAGKPRLVWALLLAFTVLLFTACGGGNASSPGKTKAPSSASQPNPGAGHYVVVLESGTTAADVANLGASLAARPDHSYRTVFNGFAGALTGAEHARLSSDPRVKYIEPDTTFYMYGKPPPPPPPPPQRMYWGIDRIDADLNAKWPDTAGDGVTIAILDTGIDLDHPDLTNADGSLAVIANYNAIFPTKPADDDNGHGTHVAGIAAARNNEIGWVGVAPNADLVAVKVLNRQGSGKLSWILDGIDWTAQHAAQYDIKLANMSLGGPGYNQSLYDAIDVATYTYGVTFFVAAGNNSADASDYSPAGFDNVIAVSAAIYLPKLSPADRLAVFSNYGLCVDLIAPGYAWSLWKDGGYLFIYGTSQAAPHAVGAAALWLDDPEHECGFAAIYQALCVTYGEQGPTGGWYEYDLDGVAEPYVNAEPL